MQEKFVQRKMYLQTWFICLMVALWPFVIPAIVGIVLIVLQFSEDKKLKKKYGEIDELESKISESEKSYSKRIASYEERVADLHSKIHFLQLDRDDLIAEKASLEADMVCEHYNFSDYDNFTSEACKSELVLIKQQESDLIRDDSALSFTSTGSKKEVSDNKKQILRCFNSECDNAIMNLSVKSIDSTRNKITKSFESLNKIFAVDGIQINQPLLKLKLKELDLVYTFELKKAQEIAQQKAIREQMIEEEKVRREIERQKAKIEKDQAQCSNEITKLMSYMQKTQSDVEKQLYVDKIKELEEKMKQLETDKATVLEREANARAGYVYIISNIGSFGEDVFKIGMTRRLEPMDRIKELGSASVPFEFDVHAMIFSDDAPTLETALHQKFQKQSLNRVNLRKEFFKVSLDEIEAAVKEKYSKTTIFTRIPVAREYNETLAILEKESA